MQEMMVSMTLVPTSASHAIIELIYKAKKYLRVAQSNLWSQALPPSPPSL